jgi:hypothetical protein
MRQRLLNEWVRRNGFYVDRSQRQAMSGKVDWYIHKHDTQETHGPLRRRDLLGMRDEGTLVPEDFVFADGVLPDWTPAGKIRQLFDNGGPKWRYAFSQPPDQPSLNLYLFEGEDLCGPITLDQLREMVRLRQASPLTQVLNWDDETVHVAAELMGVQLRVDNQPVEESALVIDEGMEELPSDDLPVIVPSSSDDIDAASPPERPQDRPVLKPIDPVPKPADDWTKPAAHHRQP